MKNKLKLFASLPIACAMAFTSCYDDIDLTYKGNIDLNQLGLKQAVEIWDGTQCNVITELEQPSDINENIDNFIYNFNMSLYQNRTAGQDVTADLIIDVDSLNKAIANAETSSVYSIYNGAELLPAEFYNLAGEELVLRAGAVESDNVELNVSCEALVDFIQNDRKESVNFVLPVSIANSTSYAINAKTSTIMFFFNVTYIEPQEEEGDAFAADTEGVPDGHTLDNGLVLKFHDEFNGTGKPDASVWRFEEGFVRNEELQWYTDRNAEMDGQGALVFTGKAERVQNPNYDASSSDWKLNRQYAEYTSSSIVSSYRFRKGTMIVRAKIPAVDGAWPAIWTTGTSDEGYTWQWPFGGEIDLLEYYLVGGVPSIHANACWGGNSRYDAVWDSYNRPLAQFTADDPEWADKYHIWRMDWTDDTIELYLDDELMNTIDLNNTTNGDGNGFADPWWYGAWRNPFRDEGNEGSNFGQQIFLNLAMGGNGGDPAGNVPFEYLVDYVRVYQHPE